MSTNFNAVSIEKVKSYWNARPCNIRHSPAPLASEEYFNQVELRKYFVEPHIPAFAEFEKWRGKTVLEIGCGIGTDTINFARAGAKVTAVDVSAESLSMARKRADLFGLSDQIEFFEADAEHLADHLPAREYDLIYSFGVIHHSPNPQKIVEQVREHFIHSQSRFKLMVYHRHSWKVLQMLMSERGKLWSLDEIIAKYSEAQTGCPVTYSYSMKSVRELIGKGFEIEDAFVEHIFPYQVPKYVNYEYDRKWYIKCLPTPFFRALEKRFGWHLCVTAKPA